MLTYLLCVCVLSFLGQPSKSTYSVDWVPTLKLPPQSKTSRGIITHYCELILNHSCSARAKHTLFLAKSVRTIAHFIM